MTLGGHDLSQVAPHQRLARGMAYAPQEDVVFGDLSVQENLWLHLDDRDLAALRGLPAGPSRAWASGWRSEPAR